MRGLRLSLALIALFTFAAQAQQPLLRAHAHNDYLHQRPLFDALAHGFWSVEADVWLTNGQLLVAHDLDKVTPERTLEKLYLAPLGEFSRTNAVTLKRAGPFTLMIDIKSDATNTWLALREQLARYTNILTRFDRTGVNLNKVTVIISGNRAIRLIGSEELRFASIDGRLPDLDVNPAISLMYLVSDNWTKHFKWDGRGNIPDAERRRLRDIVSKAHAQGRRIRFWALPDAAPAWQELHDAGVDLINTDRLEELESFLRAQ
jgi:glycerophosphoryl diester phosphodiesterase